MTKYIVRKGARCFLRSDPDKLNPRGEFATERTVTFLESDIHDIYKSENGDTRAYVFLLPENNRGWCAICVSLDYVTVKEHDNI